MAMHLQGDDEDETRPFAEINVTPFVDVMLVLLVIFMVAAPMLTAGVPVDLPRAAADRLAPPEPPVELTLTREGTLLLAREEVAEADLPARLAALHVAAPDRALHLRADRGIEHGEVVRLLVIANRAGMRRVALVSQAPGAR